MYPIFKGAGIGKPFIDIKQIHRNVDSRSKDESVLFSLKAIDYPSKFCNDTYRISPPVFTTCQVDACDTYD